MIALVCVILVALPRDSQLLNGFHRVTLEHTDLAWVLAYVGAAIPVVPFLQSEVRGGAEVQLALV